ncbi:MAG TPA: hypothetical protein VF625_10390 [Longimicrobium sp.]|jgi:hypothetical protein
MRKAPATVVDAWEITHVEPTVCATLALAGVMETVLRRHHVVASPAFRTRIVSPLRRRALRHDTSSYESRR